MKSIYIFLISLLSITAFAEESVFDKNVQISVSSETIKEGGETYQVYTLQSTQLEISGMGLHKEFKGRELGYELVLSKITRTEKWWQGLDGREVTLTIDSYIQGEDGKFSDKLSTIVSEGHDFSGGYDHQVFITKYGCCDGPTFVYTFDITSGELIHTEEEQD